MTLFDSPIYSGDPLFGSLKNTACPKRTDICNNLPGLFVTEGTIPALPLCSQIQFTADLNESPYGCCRVDISNETCDEYFTGDIKPEDAKFYDMGIDITDSSGLNPHSVCHSAPIRKRNLVISDIIVIIIVSAIIVIITAVIGACYEFLFKYGECKDCIYYKSKCANVKKLSIIEYMFPVNICSYPYQECTKNPRTQAGGENDSSIIKDGISKYTSVSKYAEYTASGTKCITIHDEVILTSKPFPYNLIDYSNDNIKSEFFRMPYKAFALFFLYTVLLSRILISRLLKRLSIRYQEIIKNSDVLSNIMFLFFTGVLFNIIAKYTNIPELHGANGYILYVLVFILAIAFAISCTATMFFLVWFPPTMFNRYYAQCGIPPVYYKLINYKKIFFSAYEYKTAKPLWKKIIYIFVDILMILIPIPIMFMFSVGVGLFSSTLAFMYMLITLLINMFYIPLSNTVEFLDIIKSHGNLLTILFCVTVIMASLKKLNNTTTGILGGLLGLIILYTLIKNLK